MKLTLNLILALSCSLLSLYGQLSEKQTKQLEALTEKHKVELRKLNEIDNKLQQISSSTSLWHRKIDFDRMQTHDSSHQNSLQSYIREKSSLHKNIEILSKTVAPYAKNLKTAQNHLEDNFTLKQSNPNKYQQLIQQMLISELDHDAASYELNVLKLEVDSIDNKIEEERKKVDASNQKVKEQYEIALDKANKLGYSKLKLEVVEQTKIVSKLFSAKKELLKKKFTHVTDKANPEHAKSSYAKFKRLADTYAAQRNQIDRMIKEDFRAIEIKAQEDAARETLLKMLEIRNQ